MTKKETLDKVLFSMLGSEELVMSWWKSPNKAFEGETPETVYEKDKVKVVCYVLQHTSYNI